MACSLRNCFFVSRSNEIELRRRAFAEFSPSVVSLQFSESKSRDLPVFKSEFKGKNVVVSDHKGLGYWSIDAPSNFTVHAQASICVSRSLRWWEKTLTPNMVEIKSAQQLVDSLLNAGDKLVIIDFYSLVVGGCKTLHPKICQLAELNPDALLLKVNYEQLKTMCYGLNVHVLPFFRFYRGAEGRLCSFSCTNATIKKFKDALSKHGTDRCSLGPAKGLDKSELLKLASNGMISIDLPFEGPKKAEDFVLANSGISSYSSVVPDKIKIKDDNGVLVA